MKHTSRLFAGLATGIAVLVTLVGVAAADGAPGVAGAAGATGSTGSTGAGPLTATLSACHTDALVANRYAIFASQMDAVPGTVTMSVSFQLLERSGNGLTFTSVAAPGFDTWVTSQRGVGIFTYSHEVTGLPAPAAFRVLVRARWIGRRKHVLRSDQHLSPACVEPLLQPDLSVVGPIAHGRTTAAGTEPWSVEVRNNGAAAAGPFQVSLAIAGGTPVSVAVSGLAAGASQAVELDAPRCTTGQTVTVTADPAGAITEPPDPKRTRTVTCSA